MTTLVSTAAIQDPRELEQAALKQFPPIFYRTEPDEASASFRLTRAVLRDIWADRGADTSPQECHYRLFNGKKFMVHSLKNDSSLSQLSQGTDRYFL
jgi:hypothetical protein